MFRSDNFVNFYRFDESNCIGVQSKICYFKMYQLFLMELPWLFYCIGNTLFIVAESSNKKIAEDCKRIERKFPSFEKRKGNNNFRFRG